MQGGSHAIAEQQELIEARQILGATGQGEGDGQSEPVTYWDKSVRWTPKFGPVVKVGFDTVFEGSSNVAQTEVA